MNSKSCFTELTVFELSELQGGAEKPIVEQLFYFLGQTAKSITVFCTTAMEYQSSLPANLKK